MEAVKSQRVRDVLLVDDSENDRILLSEALRSAEPSLRIHHVSDGDECLAFLRAGAENGTHAVPDLVLLDLHLRRMEGTEVLGALRSDLLLCHVPVVVLSTSASAHEVAEVYRLGCRSYMVKPASFVEMRRAMQLLVSYWSEVAQRPSPTLLRAATR